MYEILPSGQTVEVLHYPDDAMGNEWIDEGGEGYTHGFYYVYGDHGYLWDGEPIGPFDTYAKALDEATEDDLEVLAQ